MPPKQLILTTAIGSGLGGDASIVDTNLQVITIGQLREIIENINIPLVLQGLVGVLRWTCNWARYIGRYNTNKVFNYRVSA